jgi:hypothetical protein
MLGNKWFHSTCQIQVGVWIRYWKIQTLHKGCSFKSVRTYLERLRINFLETEAGVDKILFCWLLSRENLWIWTPFWLLKTFMNELSTVVKILCWSELFTDDLRKFSICWFSGLEMPCCANESVSYPWEVPDWHTGQFWKSINYWRESLQRSLWGWYPEICISCGKLHNWGL